MSTEFDSILAADAAGFLADFGELVTFTPSAGTPRSIRAVVTRYPNIEERIDSRDPVRAIRPAFDITVLNDATTGIDLGSLQLSADSLTLTWFSTDQTFVILDPPFTQDAGLLTFRF
jgi:hypothetical protein